MAFSDDDSPHRRPREIRHSRASNRGSSVGIFLNGILSPFGYRRTSPRSSDPPLHPAPASARNPAYAPREDSKKEQNFLSPTPVEGNKGHYVQAGEKEPSNQARTEFLQIIEQKDTEIQDLQVELVRRKQQYETDTKHMQENCPEAIQKRNIEIQNSQAEHDQRIQQYETYLRDLEDNYTEAIQKRDACITQLRRDNTNLERNLTGLSGECNRLHSVAVTAQEGALRAMEKGGWAAMEDRVVRGELAKLQEEMRSWARKYSKATVDSDLKNISCQKDKVVEELQEYCMQTNWQSLLDRMPISLNKVPLVLVHALLAKVIFQNLFADPFFAFPETVDDPILPNRATMQLLYGTMTQLNDAEAQIWRSQMIRILSASPTDSSGKGPLMPDRLQRVASAYTKDFINGPAQIFLRDPENNTGVIRRSDDLHKLYHQAGKLALSLWAQRTVIASHGQQRLHEFNSSSPFMTAHRLHHLDEDDKRLDGRKILLCIQPVVLAFGNENGEHYDKSKIWAKAVVLVEGDAVATI